MKFTAEELDLYIKIANNAKNIYLEHNLTYDVTFKRLSREKYKRLMNLIFEEIDEDN